MKTSCFTAILALCGSAAAFDIGLPQDLKVLVAKQTAEQKAEERRQIQAAQLKRLDAAVDKWLAKAGNNLASEEKRWAGEFEDENHCADSFFDFCADHSTELQTENIRRETVLHLAWFFKHTLARGFHFHSRILEHLTPANVTRIVKKLEAL